MSINNIFYISFLKFRRKININMRIIILTFLFAFIYNILSTLAVNLSETNIKAEESASRIIVYGCGKDIISSVADKLDLKISEICFENNNLIITGSSVTEAYQILSLLREMNYNAEHYGQDSEYHSYFNSIVIGFLKVIKPLFFICTGIALLFILMKKFYGEESEYKIYLCLGFTQKNIKLMLLIDEIMITFIPSVLGYVISVPANVIVMKKILNNYLLYDCIYDISTLLITELLLFIFIITIFIIVSVRFRSIVLSSAFERKV